MDRWISYKDDGKHKGRYGYIYNLYLYGRYRNLSNNNNKLKC